MEKDKVEAAKAASPMPAKEEEPPDEAAKGVSPDKKRKIKFLGKVKLFKRLSDDLLLKILDCSKEAKFKPGQEIIKKGDEGDEMFVIIKGEAVVVVGDKKVAKLKSGDYFGEAALLRNEARTATIKATEKVLTIKINRDDFQELNLNESLNFKQRKAVGGGGKKPQSPPPKKAKANKSDAEKVTITEALKNNTNLQAMVTLDEARIQQLIDVSWKQSVKKDTKVIKEGDMDADYFYIVEDGSFDVFIREDPEDPNSAEKNAGTVTKGGSFGELALLYLAPRKATVVASTDAVVFVIDRGSLKSILAKSADDIARQTSKYLDKIEILEPLSKEEKLAVAKALTEMSFSKGEDIFHQGEQGEIFYILTEGEVDVVQDQKKQCTLVGSEDKCQIFGERALMDNAPRGATITVVSETARTLTMDRESFTMLLGPLGDLKSGAKGENRVRDGAALAATAINADDKRFGKIKQADLTTLGLLGAGGFGAVELVEHTQTKDTYALKSVSKGLVAQCGMEQNIKAERDIQLMCESPFIIKLYETFADEQGLLFLLELSLGGELYATYNKKGLHGSLKHAKFYVAGVVCAFEHLHKRKIIFRDLKPENLLLTDTGRIKLTDMGLAKVVIGQTFTTCGTPDYFAPEMIASTGHTVAVDWWTLGILAFELMAGNPPFEAASPNATYVKVRAGIKNVEFPPRLKGALEELIKSLLVATPTERLPMKKGGSRNIRSHKWYAGFDWDGFEKTTMEPPYKPQVKSKTDIANFSVQKEDMPTRISYHDDGSGVFKDFATSS